MCCKFSRVVLQSIVKTKSITVRLPEQELARLEKLVREQDSSLSSVVREAVAEYGAKRSSKPRTMDIIADLVGSVKGLPPDLSSRTDHYLRKWGYGKDSTRGHRVPRRASR
jgi:hypothetical protein